MSKESSYFALPTSQGTLEEDSDHESSDTLLTRPVKYRGKPPLRSSLYFGILIGTSFLCCALSFLAGFFWKHDLAKTCFSHTSMYSPIEEDMNIKYHDVEFNNTLLRSNIYREDPSPEVDQAWQGLGVRWNNMTVPQRLGEKTQIPNGSIRVQDEYGGGYTALLEVFHQLHCLDLIRKTSYYNYEYYLQRGEDEFFDGEPMLKSHFGHCIDILRLQLMCSADVGLVPFVWVHKRQWMEKEDVKPHRLPYFQNTHRCRNFDAIKDWYKEKQDFRPFNHVQWHPRSSEIMWENYY